MVVEIEVKDCVKSFGANAVLRGVSFSVQTGEKVALVGENGSGKSTLFKILSRELAPDSGVVAIRKGKVPAFLGQFPDTSPESTVWEVLGSVFAEQFRARAELEALEAEMGRAGGEALDRVLERYGRLQDWLESNGGYDFEKEMERVRSGLRIGEEWKGRPYGGLSGGEKSRVELARILLRNAGLLLLDEPTNHLDLESIEWLEEFIRKFPGEVLIISHDRYFLDRVVTRVVEIEDGESFVYESGYTGFLAGKAARLESREKQFRDQQRKVKEMEAAIHRFKEWGGQAGVEDMFKKAEHMRKRIERMTKVDRPVLNRPRMALAFPDAGRAGEDVVVAEGLRKSFGGREVLSGLGLHLRHGERLCLLGRNGSGKTTLLRMLAGLVPPDAGTLRAGPSVRPGFVEQEIRFSDPSRTVLRHYQEFHPCDETEARKGLARFLFRGTEVFSPLSALSGGEKVRLKLCELMRLKVNLLVLDEPTNHLDAASREVLEESLEEYTGTVLCVSHDRYFLNRIADRVGWLEEGRLHVVDGDYEDFLAWKARRGASAAATARPRLAAAKARGEGRGPGALADRIGKIESDLAAKGRFLEGEADPARRLHLADEVRRLEGSLDAMYTEWMRLEEAAGKTP